MNSRGITGLALLSATGVLASAGPASANVTATFSNPTPITINDAVTSGVAVPASPSPSIVSVGALPAKAGTRPTVSVTLHGVTHTSPADLVVTLDGGLGSGVLLENAGGVTTPVSNATLTFGLGGPQIPFAGPMVSGAFTPSRYTFGGAPIFSTALLRYTPGVGRLYVADNDPGDTGVIAGGFSADVTYVPENAFTLGGASVNKKKGTATLKVTVPDPGVIALKATKTVKGATVNAPAAGTYVVPVKAAGKSLKKLKRKHKFAINAAVDFTPTGGTAARQSKTFTLKLKKKKHKKH